MPHRNGNWESWTGSSVGFAALQWPLLDHWMLLCSPMMTRLKITARGVDQHSCRPDPLMVLWLTSKV
jgi:hypothetical protein